MRRRGGGCGWTRDGFVLLLLALPAASLPAGLAAQRPDSLRPDTLSSDTLTAADSARLRIQRRLKALSRPLGVRPDTTPILPQERPVSPLPGTGGVDDPVLNALAALPGYRVTAYSGVAAEYMAEEEMLLLYGELGRGDTIPPAPDTTEAEAPAEPPEAGGERQVTRASLSTPEGERLEALEFIRYERRKGVIDARGEPTFSAPDQNDPVRADSLSVDLDQRRASAFNSRTRYEQEGSTTWNLAGDLPWISEEVTYGAHTRFTSCDREDPHYHFRTNHLKIKRGEILVARPVVLYFGDVPVAWLPFIATSLKQGRSSGLLTPRFSVNDIVRANTGHRRRLSNVGFYWAVNDYVDATVALDWFDENFTSVTASLNYRWLRQFLGGSVNLRQFWRESGSTEQSVNANTNWEINEVTNFRASIRYASSTSFVRRQSFDPRSVTQRISSSGGLRRSFEWGTLNASANRQQSISNDEVDLTFPNVSLSLNPITFFGKVDWNGGLRFDRRTRDRAPDTTGFSFRSADVSNVSFSLSQRFTLGAFGISQNLAVERGSTFDVPTDSLVFFPERVASEGLGAFDGRVGRAYLARELGLQEEGEVVDISQTELNWSTSLNYQISLRALGLGSTTLTPGLSFSGRARQSDTVSVAQDFVSAPTRISFNAGLGTDLYGFYPGFGSYEAVRHKVSPGISFRWSPEVDPSELQTRVFGSRSVRPTKVLTLSLNQTWEAKQEVETPDSAQAAPDSAPSRPSTLSADPAEPRRPERAPTVNLLSIRTNTFTYDLVEADSTGRFLDGFETTRMTNQISSDALVRGLSVTMAHDLFEEVPEGDGPDAGTRREFSPHLSSVNFGFNLNPRSGIMRLLGFGSDQPALPDSAEAPSSTDVFDERSSTDETTVLPGRGVARRTQSRGPRRSGGVGNWSARFTYSLNRPRRGGSSVSQVLGIGVNLNPTPSWEMSWDTAYDIERGNFNDHRIRLTRDLHRWQAHFSFLQSTTGNWTFRFEVSLMDNEDLKFDYEQRNVESRDIIRPTGGSGD